MENPRNPRYEAAGRGYFDAMLQILAITYLKDLAGSPEARLDWAHYRLNDDLPAGTKSFIQNPAAIRGGSDRKIGTATDAYELGVITKLNGACL